MGESRYMSHDIDLCPMICPMITSMKSTHESVPFKHSVVRLYSSFMI